MKSAGIFLLVAGIIMIIIACTANFCHMTTSSVPSPFGGNSFSIPDYECNNDLKNFLLYGGIIASVAGLIMFMVYITSSKSMNNNIQVFQSNQPSNQSTNNYCNSCGKKYNTLTAGKFCEECGAKINE